MKKNQEPEPLGKKSQELEPEPLKNKPALFLSPLGKISGAGDALKKSQEPEPPKN